MSRHPSSAAPTPNRPHHGRRPSLRLFVALAVVLLGAADVALAVGPVTGPARIDAVARSSQFRPAVAIDAAGSFVVVQESFTSVGGGEKGLSLQGRLYDAQGSPIGSSFQVYSSTTLGRLAPAVAKSLGGDFVVVWQSPGAGPEGSRILAQRYHSSGARMGSVLTVASGGKNEAPAVAMASDGDFVVVWRKDAGDGGDLHPTIQGRRFGHLTGGFHDPFPVSSRTTWNQDDPAIATDGNLTYLVAWEEGVVPDIAIRSFTANDSLREGLSANGLEQTANTTTSPASQAAPWVAMTPDGRAIVAWESAAASTGGESGSSSIQARRLDSAGAFLDPFDVPISTNTQSRQGDAALIATPRGLFAVAWMSFGPAGGNHQDRSLLWGSSPSGGPMATVRPGDVQARLRLIGDLSSPIAAPAPNDRLFVSWESAFTVSSGTNTVSSSTVSTSTMSSSIHGRGSTVLFADGFETGDTSRWGAPTPSGPSPAPTAVGVPTGTAASKTIGAAGGQLISGDGRLTVLVPAGALSVSTTIGIAPITNEAHGGLGAGYRLTPDGQSFAQPVTLRRAYTDEELQGTAPEALGFAFQTATGHWQRLQGAVVNTVAKTVSSTTDHFTDYSQVRGFQILPHSKTVKVSSSADLRVVYCYDPSPGHASLGYACDQDSFDGDPDLTPLIPTSTVSDWRVNGIAGGNGTVGTVSALSKGALYRAPASVPNANPVAVSAKVTWQGNTTRAVANLTIVDGIYTGNLNFEYSHSSLGHPLTGPTEHVVGSSFVTWTQFEDMPDVARYLPSAVLNVTITYSECDPLVTTLTVEAGTPAAAISSLVVYRGNNPFTPSYFFALSTVPKDLTFFCGDPRRAITFTYAALFGTATCFGLGYDLPTYADESQLASAGYFCPLLDGQVQASWDFRAAP